MTLVVTTITMMIMKMIMRIDLDRCPEDDCVYGKGGKGEETNDAGFNNTKNAWPITEIAKCISPKCF